MLTPGGRVRALLELCAVLAGHGDDVVTRRPRWESVATVAEEHLLDGALWVALREGGMTDDVGPVVAHELRWAQRRAALAEAGFRRQAVAAVTILNRQGVVPLVVKGGAFVLDGTLPVAARAMHDIDLLVAAKELDVSVTALEEIGYRVRHNPTMESRHERVLVRDDLPGPIDLHFQLGERPVTDVLPTGEVVASAIDRGGGSAHWRCLSPTHAVLHNIVHSQLQDLNHVIAGIPVRQLHTYVLLGRRPGNAIDWRFIARRLADRRLTHVHAGHSELARRLFGFATPGATRTAEAAAHYARCLLTFAVPGGADIQRNLRFAFDPDYLHHLYGQGGSFRLGIRHARILLGTRGHHVLRESIVPRAR